MTISFGSLVPIHIDSKYALFLYDNKIMMWPAATASAHHHDDGVLMMVMHIGKGRYIEGRLL